MLVLAADIVWILWANLLHVVIPQSDSQLWDRWLAEGLEICGKAWIVGASWWGMRLQDPLLLLSRESCHELVVRCVENEPVDCLFFLVGSCVFV